MTLFEETGLKEDIVKAVTDLGFERPTPIQEKSIPHILESDQDLVAFAQTGTGKTAAFSLPVLHKIDPEVREIQALVLCPTRELALQIHRDVESFTKYMPVRATAVYGGASIEQQIRQIRRGTHMVVGTPGRVRDLLRRGVLNFEGIRFLILDEADEMLTMGFKDELDLILSEVNEERQTLLFSATMPPELDRIASQYMEDPAKITTGKRNMSADTVTHQFSVVHRDDRYEALKRYADIHPGIYGIVFCRTRNDTKEVADRLAHDGYSADALHGDLSQAQRDHVMNRFRKRQLQILVATDVAARGLDIQNLTHVINMGFPDDPEVYVHRSGRTGRAGNEGEAMSILTPRDTRRIRMLERMMKKEFQRLPIATGEEICERQLFHFIDKVKEVEINEEQIANFLPAVEESLAELSREELIKKFVSIEFNRFLEYYDGARDLNEKRRRGDRDRDRDRRDRYDRRDRDDRGDRGGRRERFERDRSADFSRFYINVGSKQELDPKKLIRLINDRPEIRKAEIGRIEILRKFSFFELEKRFESEVVDAFNGTDFEGTPIVVEITKDGPKPSSHGGRSGGGRGRGRGDYRGGRDRRGGGGGGRRRRHQDAGFA
ncbi:DEAD/DEAH box helicase [Pontibacter sp. G13]|uniref:DEAD/DEAH box helicase n=1 Tax=Pontibacter sp. G13 TaxID=3074898 RepID=UPI00288BF334|nr:DEAD/DEAH box helicase [Pontibacter sp. G13]WNJ18743.1 DEAD/DEAH box helicase [Pontibacter sp. G13]